MLRPRTPVGLAVLVLSWSAVLAVCTMAGAEEPELSGVAAVADAVLWGKEMPAAAHRKLCASEMDGSHADGRSREMADEARRQLVRARDGGHRLIRVVAERLLATGRCSE